MKAFLQPHNTGQDALIPRSSNQMPAGDFHFKEMNYEIDFLS
jgi:hypothetical protein